MSDWDRLTQRRSDDAWIAARLADPEARFVVVADAHVSERTGLPDDIAPGDLHEPIFLGALPRDGRDDDPSSVAWPGTAFALAAERNPDLAAAATSRVPVHAAVVDSPDVVLHAVGAVAWQSRTRFCPRCGAALVSQQAGHVRTCTVCGTQHFPRLEPAVIVRITHGERILLARQSSWPAGRVSVLAGFVEPGESAEDAVHREIGEEVGITLTDVRYERSQPWPFPSSLMLAYAATATSTELHLDQDEIAEAWWLTRDELRAAMERGELALPPSLSVAWNLITAWLGDEAVAVWDLPGRR